MSPRIFSPLRIVAAAVVMAAVHTAFWLESSHLSIPPDVTSPLQSVSLGYDIRNLPTTEEIQRDVRLLSGTVAGLRTYSSAGDLESIVRTAEEEGMRVTMGAWVQDIEEIDRKEIEIVVALANRYPATIAAVMVGNETLLREEKTGAELAALVREVKGRVRAPVSTAENWDIWLNEPELAEAVDFIAAHILPYWDGVPAERAVDYTLERYRQLQQRYPNKKIVIAEFGWPTRGYNNHASIPDPVAQADVVRRFAVRAEMLGIDYNLIEAFDHPWKRMERFVGPHWGLYSADRVAKFPLRGPVLDLSGLKLAPFAIALGFLLTIGILWVQRPTVGHALLYGVAANLVGVGLVAAAAYPIGSYLPLGLWVAWGVGVGALLFLKLSVLLKVEEVASVTLGAKPRRLLMPRSEEGVSAPMPRVSLHIPAYREPPEMLVATLESVAQLDYPNFEVLVIVNNTPEEHFWKPVEAKCAELGERFRFLHLLGVEGFKAGALNLALDYTDPQAEIIGVLDADYTVHPHWLKDLVPCFQDPKIALVQAPQDHRDAHESPIKRMMNAEYAGFFDIGMVQRNEDDAIVAHGTMLLLRRSAMAEVGNWSTRTIVEDSELGLRLLLAGYSTHYTTHRYGWGLLPDNFGAYQTQRHRWAYGAVQIIRAYWRHFLPGAAGLNAAQKWHFAGGWFRWLSDALGVLFSLLSLVWVPVVLAGAGAAPPLYVTVPLLVASTANLFTGLVLYRARVRLPLVDTLGAAFASLSLQFVIGRAVWDGVLRDGLGFKRTEKGGGKKRRAPRVAMWETLVGLLLLVAAGVVYRENHYGITEVLLYSLSLAIQSLPFLAAGVMRGLEIWLGRREREEAGSSLAVAPLTLPLPSPLRLAPAHRSEAPAGV